jgi:predicted Fe-Mo cluster-binding NifX family protein
VKIAVASMTGQTVTRHYGRAKLFVVLAVENGCIVAEETREKPRSESSAGHLQGFGRLAADLVADCDVVIAGGMGRRAAEHLAAAGVAAVLTDERDVRTAALRWADGSLPHLEERFHEADSEP